MTTLLLELAAPLQSWGSRSRFIERDTEREPSKSGVIGLLCAALGRSRDEPVDDLARLRMGVRVDREGRVLRDFHTVQGVVRANKRSRQLSEPEAVFQHFARVDPVISNRYYLTDAVFLVGLEGPRALLAKVQEALRSPTHEVFLGRKACPPSRPLVLPDGLRDDGLENTLRRFPWCGGPLAGRHKQSPAQLRLVLEVAMTEDGLPRRDQPLSFAERRFGERRVRESHIPCPEPRAKEQSPCI